jgi:hypothetical protein
LGLQHIYQLTKPEESLLTGPLHRRWSVSVQFDLYSSLYMLEFRCHGPKLTYTLSTKGADLKRATGLRAFFAEAGKWLVARDAEVQTMVELRGCGSEMAPHSQRLSVGREAFRTPTGGGRAFSLAKPPLF